MARFARIDTVTNAIVEFREFDARPEDLPQKNVRWLPADPVKAPDFDARTEVRTGPFHVVMGDAVIETWTVRAKSAGELSDDVDAKIARVDEATRLAITALEGRVSALEGRQSRGFFGFLRDLFGGA